MRELPVDAALPDLKEALCNQGCAVLIAPPGAGKTTRVPPALLNEPWLAGRRILMLEPRRLAARSAARYMAGEMGEKVGGTVGYRVRMDTRVGPRTRIEVITEGVLTRLLQADPSLEGVGAVLFDEFHERSLHADLGLALCLQAQGLLREDLRLLVMSATLEAEPVAELLGGAPVIVSEGRMYPVETRYMEKRQEGPLEQTVVRAVLQALEDSAGGQAGRGQEVRRGEGSSATGGNSLNGGDILVFLPGAGEIRRVEARLTEALRGRSVRVAALHGSLPQEAQDRALSGGGGLRKVVLATSIAETSLTVEGVRIVVDSGLSRVPRFSPRTGMTRLETTAVSRASADQRRGRAGRQGPGVCFRLWTEQDDRTLAPRSTPELLEADLAPLALELAAWGAAPEELRWLDAPPAPALAQARELLMRLGALDGAGAITPHGQAMAGTGLHPRLAHMALTAIPLGLGPLACELAAVLGERDFLKAARGAADADLRLRVEALHGGGAAHGEAASLGLQADGAAMRRIQAEAAQYMRELGVSAVAAGRGSSSPGGPVGGRVAVGERQSGSEAGRAGREGWSSLHDTTACGLLLALAYPDRIGMRRSNGRFLLRNGRGASLAEGQRLSQAPFLVAAELDDQGAESRIYLAAPLELADLEEHLHDQVEEEKAVVWDRSSQAVRARKRVRLGALVLREGPLANPDPQLCLNALLQGIAEEGLGILPWTKAAKQLRERLGFMHRADPSWPDMSEEALLRTLREWLGPFAHGMKSRSDLDKLNLASMLEHRVGWNRVRELEDMVPTHVTVPSGSRIPVDYSDPQSPVLAVRLQELFGLRETPRIAGGRVPLTLHLLSPAHRPVQVTQDLASFWQNAYFEVKKDLKGRYPKHYWPDDPLEAMATNRAKPRQS